jgi:hypothetical protein
MIGGTKIKPPFSSGQCDGLMITLGVVCLWTFVVTGRVAGGLWVSLLILNVLGVWARIAGR